MTTFFLAPDRTTRNDRGRGAKSHDSWARTALCVTFGVATLSLGSCDDATPEASAASNSSVSGSSPEKAIERMIELATELDLTLTSDYHDRHFHSRVAFLEELRGAPLEVGEEALRTFLDVEARSEVAPIMVRVCLLDIASHAATEKTVPVLESLLMEYGHRIDIRTEATLLLGSVAPERAVALITPLLERTKNTSTMPADEFLVQAYVMGCEGSGTDPVRILADVATNIFKEDAARHLAVKELGKHNTQLARMALRQILVESTGNGYLRRKAAQSIRKSFAREEACEIFRLVSSREADNNFLMFLADMIEENCE